MLEETVMPDRPKYITSMLGHPASRTVVCLKCGAIVVDTPDWRLLHDDHHQEIDEMIEWAQAVSKTFDQANALKEEQNGGSLGTKL